MSTHTLRRKLLLSTATLIGALAAYGGRAYGQQVCVPPVGTTFTCDGSSSDTQDLTFATTNVITDDDFSVNTGDANAITITGAGAISFTDSYSAPYSSLTAGVGYTALFIRSTGDIGGGNAGSVTVTTNGTLIGDSTGISAVNDGMGALDAAANGRALGHRARKRAVSMFDP